MQLGTSSTAREIEDSAFLYSVSQDGMGCAKSSAKTGDTVMSVNPNKHEMDAQDVILNFCNMESSSNNNDFTHIKPCES